MKRIYLISALLLAGLLTTGCRKEPLDVPTPSVGETRDLVLTFSTGEPETKSGESVMSDLAHAQDGRAFSDLLVVITKDEVVVQAQYVNKFNTDGTTGEGAIAGYVTKAVLTFPALELGDYHVGAYANIEYNSSTKLCDNPWISDSDKLIAYTDGGNTVAWPDGTTTVEALLSALIDKPYVSYRKLKVCANSAPSPAPDSEAPTAQNAVPPLGDHPMLLTRHDYVTVRVVEDPTQAEGLELLRPVSRIKVVANNHSDKAVTVKKLWFSEFNPNTAYLMPYWSGSGEPQVPPAGVSNWSLPIIKDLTPSDPSDDVVIAANADEAQVYPVSGTQFLYESKASLYKIYAEFEMTVGDNTKTVRLGLPKLYTKTELEAMAVNGTKTVMLVNASTNNNTGCIFGYSGSALTRSFIRSSDAESMLNMASSILVSGSADPYKLTLTKVSDGHFTLKKGGNNIISPNGGFELVNPDGNNPTPNYVLSDLPESATLRLKSSSNYYKHDVNASNNQYIKTASSNTNSHIFIWAILDAESRDGSTLKYLDEKSSKVTPVHYIQRNLDITVILNIYYQEGEFLFDFEVDNDNWAGTTSGHSYKYVHVTGITVSPSTLALTAGGAHATLSATVAPDNATNKTVHWSSSDPAKATVDDATGEVTPLAAGTVTITATTEDGQKTATCEVTVS